MPSKIQKQLRQDIKNLVNELNAELTEYYQSGEKVEIFETAIETAAKKAHGKGRAGGLSKGWNLNKIEDLKKYKNDLQRLKNFNMFTPAAIERQEAINKKGYDTFQKNHPEYTRDMYDQLSDVFKATEDKIVDELKSDQIVEIYDKARAKGMKSDTLSKIIKQKYELGAKRNLNPEAVSLMILNSIKYGRFNR